MTAIHLIIGTLQRMNVFGIENRDTLTHKATGVNIHLHYSISCLYKCYGLYPEVFFCLLPVFCEASKETRSV